MTPKFYLFKNKTIIRRTGCIAPTQFRLICLKHEVQKPLYDYTKKCCMSACITCMHVFMEMDLNLGWCIFIK